MVTDEQALLVTNSFSGNFVEILPKDYLIKEIWHYPESNIEKEKSSRKFCESIFFVCF